MRRRRRWWRGACWTVAGGLLVGPVGGCTRASVRLALEAQRRADQVQQAVFARQAEALRILLYRDLAARLSAEQPLTEGQRAALDAAWNERDLLEFWALQQERARGLRLAVVDAELAGDQSIVDLLVKSLEAKADRIEEAAASAAGRRVE